MRRQLVSAANSALQPLGVTVAIANREKPWDVQFAQWVAGARASGQDPNDIGDKQWSDDPLSAALPRHYLRHVWPSSIVLELGPGTGRLTRHVIGRCAEMVLVDDSQLVCEWLAEYLEGKGRYRIVQIEAPTLAPVADQSVDVVLANGVFEHLDLNDSFTFFQEFRRVLKSGGVAALNFDNILNDEALALFRQPQKRRFFRFHHPDVLRRIASLAGLDVLALTLTEGRFGYLELRKPGIARTDAPPAHVA